MHVPAYIQSLTFLWKHWNCLKWGETSIAVFRHHVPLHIIFSTKAFFADTTEPTQEQNGDWEYVRMLRIYTGFHCFPSSSSFLLLSLLLIIISIVFPPPPPHFYCFPSSSSSSSYPSTTRFTLFSPRDSIKDCQLQSLVHFETMSRVVNNNRGFLQLLADCPAYQRQFLLKTATP